MDKSDFAKINGSAPEPFSITDRATGKVRSVREMTDEELVRHTKTAGTEIANLSQQMQQAHQGMMATGQFLAVLQFEQNRRARSIAIVPAIPVR